VTYVRKRRSSERHDAPRSEGLLLVQDLFKHSFFEVLEVRQALSGQPIVLQAIPDFASEVARVPDCCAWAKLSALVAMWVVLHVRTVFVYFSHIRNT